MSDTKTSESTEGGNANSVQRLVLRLTAEDWDDAADLFEQGAVLAEMSDSGMHSAAAKQYAVKRMNSLAMFATGKAMSERERTESNAKS